jgi:hypothetical protein
MAHRNVSFMVIALSTPLYAVAMAHRLRGLGKHYSYPTKHLICHKQKIQNLSQIQKQIAKNILGLEEKGCTGCPKKMHFPPVDEELVVFV